MSLLRLRSHWSLLPLVVLIVPFFASWSGGQEPASVSTAGDKPSAYAPAADLTARPRDSVCSRFIVGGS